MTDNSDSLQNDLWNKSQRPADGGERSPHPTYQLAPPEQIESDLESVPLREAAVSFVLDEFPNDKSSLIWTAMTGHQNSKQETLQQREQHQECKNDRENNVLDDKDLPVLAVSSDQKTQSEEEENQREESTVTYDGEASTSVSMAAAASPPTLERSLRQLVRPARPGAERVGGSCDDDDDSDCEEEWEVLHRGSRSSDGQSNNQTTLVSASLVCPSDQSSLTKGLIVEAQLLSDDHNVHLVTVLFKDRKAQSVVFVLIITIGVLVAVIIRGGDDTSSPRSVSSTEKNIELLPLTETSRYALLNDPASPQSMAVEWLRSMPQHDDLSRDRIVQRYALATLFFAFSGPRTWVRSSNWLTVEHECKWFGVGQYDHKSPCSNGSYTSLSLSDNGLYGSLPDEIALLSNIRMINLSNNSLHSTIPSVVGELTNLNYFFVDINNVSGSIPTDFGRLFDLKSLSASDTDLTGHLPSELGRASSLEVLSVARTLLEGGIPTELGLMSALGVLVLASTEISGSIPTEIGEMVNLEYFISSNAFLHGTLPTEIGLLSNLIHFNVEHNIYLEGTIPSEVGLLDSLEELRLQSCNFGGQLPESLSRLRTLKTLSLGINKFEGTLPQNLGNIQTLQMLQLYQNQFTGTVPRAWSNLTNLRILDLSSNHLRGTVPEHYGFLEHLEKIWLFGNQIHGTMPETLCGAEIRVECLYFSQCDCCLAGNDVSCSG